MLDVFTGDISCSFENQGHGRCCDGDNSGITVSGTSRISYLHPEIRARGERAGGQGAAGGTGYGTRGVTAVADIPLVAEIIAAGDNRYARRSAGLPFLARRLGSDGGSISGWGTLEATSRSTDWGVSKIIDDIMQNIPLE